MKHSFFAFNKFIRVTAFVLLSSMLVSAPAAPVVVLGEAGDVVQPAQAAYISAPGFASSRANTGVAIHQINDPQLLDAVKDAGFSFVRTDLFWEAVQSPSGWHFDGYDKLVSNLAARGLGALFIFGYKHYMFNPDQPPTSASQLAAFRLYVIQATERYRNAPVRFEVWNEQDAEKYWLAPPSPSAYRRLLETAVTSAKSVNPQVVVATGGVQQIDRKFIRAVGDMSADVKTGVGLGDSGPDAVSVHPYRQEAPETVLADYSELRSDLSTYQKRPEVWATEWSYPSVGYKYVSDIDDGHSAEARARQARFAVRLLMMNWIAQVGLTSYYDMRDDGNDPKEMEHNFGLLDAKNRPLPAYHAVKRLFRFTADGKNARYSIDNVQRYVLLKLDGADAEKYVVWCYGKGNSIQLDLTRFRSNVQVTDLFGQPVNEGPEMTVSEARGPIFIAVPRQGRLVARPGQLE